jgi:protocatechuate 3,4-dioxygenase beta subunit
VGTGFARCGCLLLLVIFTFFTSSSFAQFAVTTSRGDNNRDGANTNETLLTPANVNVATFGRLFTTPIDYVAMAQPLYMPNVNIAGEIHNVVYVVTQQDSVYAIDADSGVQLWYINFTNPAAGITLATKDAGTLPCGATTGFDREGIPGTPVIDPNTNTMYLVAKTVVNGTVEHNLHALDITTGNDEAGSPVLIAATSTSYKGHVTVFNSKYQKNRPGLLLSNGNVYLGFGGNSCNGKDTGWILAYDEATLTQTGVFNTSPDYGLVSVWQTGNGLAGDSDGNVYFETAESGVNKFDVPQGGQTYCNSVVKLSPTLDVADYFTPYDVAFLNLNDLDLSASGVLLLPDQDGAHPHELVASGKQGFVYVLNRDDMGMYQASDSGALQEFPVIPGTTPNNITELMFSSPAFWNNMLYYAPDFETPTAFPVSGGVVGTPLPSPGLSSAHSPSVSANGNTDGVLWIISGPGSAQHPQLTAFDALSLQQLYNSGQAPNSRDLLPGVGHFVTQTVINGKVYIATQTTLEAFGLLQVATVTSGGGQSAPVGTPLAAPIQVQGTNPYNGQYVVGATINFSDGCKKAGSSTCGTFNPASAVTDQNGNVSTTYTVPAAQGTYTISISAAGFGIMTTTATATAGAPTKLYAFSGAKQTGAAGSNLANPIVAEVTDASNNRVPGVTVNFTANNGAVPNPSAAVTNGNGLASTTLQLPTSVGKITVTASYPGLKSVTFAETSVAGPAANVGVTGGNSQSQTVGTQLPQALKVLVTDQYGNPISGNAVTFSDGGAGGTFSSPNPAVTGTNGSASLTYTLPTTAQIVTVNAIASGLATPGVFTETAVAGGAASVTVQGGNNQTAPAGTQLPQALTVLVTDQYGNPVAGNNVTFSDGGVGGFFSNPNPSPTGANGIATQVYTLPASPGTYSISATAAGVSTPAIFTENGQ